MWSAKHNKDFLIKNMKTKLFLDTEFTGLHQDTTLISLGIISECGKTFYAEFTDYDKTQLNDWLEENVIANTWVAKHNPITSMGEIISESRWADTHVFGSSDYIKPYLEEWLSQFEKIVIWSDCLAYDWVLFNQIWGHAFSIPENIYYIPMDISTMFEIKGVNPDISREDFAYRVVSENADPLFFDDNGYMLKKRKHNALWDAFIIRECYKKLLKH
jgi:hypothetical protein